MSQSSTIPTIPRAYAAGHGATLSASHAAIWIADDGQASLYLGHGSSPEAAIADAEHEAAREGIDLTGGELVIHRIA